MSDTATMQLARVESSNLPETQKTALRRWYESRGGISAAGVKAKSHIVAAGQTIRAGGEGLMVGGLLGALETALPDGLDLKVGMAAGQGSTLPGIPIDGLVGAVSGLGSVLFAEDAASTDLRNASTAGFAVFGYRGMARYTKALQTKTKVHGEGTFGTENRKKEDPVVAAARAL